MFEVNDVIQGVVGQAEAHRIAEACVVAPNMKKVADAPWSGGLDEIELKKPGGILLAALVQCANSRGIQILDLGAKLGVTYGYINQLRNGIRCVAQIGDEFAQSCANFLQVPRLTVLILAGKMTPADLLSPGPIAERELATAMQFLSANSEFGHLVTEEQRQSSFESKYLLVKLFERATGKKLLGTEVDVEALAREMQRIGIAQTC